MKHLALIFLFVRLFEAAAMAQAHANSTPGQVAVNYYQTCGRVPLDIAALNTLRSSSALEADRKLPRSALQARSGVLSAVGGYGTLLAVRVLSERIVQDRATVSAARIGLKSLRFIWSQ